MNTILLLLPLFFLSCHAFGTCVVITRTDKQLIIGADSRRHEVFFDGTIKLHDDQCKIRQAGKYYYALVGFNDGLQIAAADYAASIAKNLDDFKNIYIDFIVHRFEKSIEAQRQRQPNLYPGQFQGLKFAQIPMFTVESSKPQLITCYFKVTNGVNEPIKVACEVEVNAQITVLGYDKTINNIRNQNPTLYKNFAKNDSIGFVRTMILNAINAHKDALTTPVDIFELTGKSNKWIQVKENCRSF